jgi:hypothetical protein
MKDSIFFQMGSRVRLILSIGLGSILGCGIGGNPGEKSGPLGPLVEALSPFPLTRATLRREYGPELLQVIRTLRVHPSRKLISENKADLYERGLQAMDGNFQQFGHEGYGKEKVGIYRLNFTNRDVHLAYFRNPKSVSVQTTSDWMNYVDPDHAAAEVGFQKTYAVFSSAQLGGDWEGDGNGQEEQVAQQCPEVALILAKHNRVISKSNLSTRMNWKDSQDKSELKFASETSANPLLLTQLRCLQKLKSPFEVQTDRIRQQRYTDLNRVLDTIQNAPPINLIALAAPELRSHERGQPYHSLLVQDLFNNAVVAFTLARLHDEKLERKTVLYLGRWGAGKRAHSDRMSVAIQYLAARFSKVEKVVFTGLTDQEVSPIVVRVDQILSKVYQSQDQVVKPTAILEELLSETQNDPNWMTQP